MNPHQRLRLSVQEQLIRVTCENGWMFIRTQLVRMFPYLVDYEEERLVLVRRPFGYTVTVMLTRLGTVPEHLEIYQHRRITQQFRAFTGIAQPIHRSRHLAGSPIIPVQVQTEFRNHFWQGIVYPVHEGNRYAALRLQTSDSLPSVHMFIFWSEIQYPLNGARCRINRFNRRSARQC